MSAKFYQNYFDANSFVMPTVIEPSGWLEHGSFAMWFIAKLRPQIFVELGTHNGFSYFSFAQSVTSNDIKTKMYAIDTWEGDEHAGFYGDDVFNSVSQVNSTRYGSFSYLLRNTFDDGLEHFQDKCIDLLHIDGLHTYDAVKHDFETWLPKMSDTGIILFHDISVRERGFGVFQLWEEISREYPSFEFIHGNGLGVLKVGKSNTNVDFLFESSQEDVKRIQAMYASLGRRISLEYELAVYKTHAAALEQKGKNDLANAQNDLANAQNDLANAQNELRNCTQIHSRTKDALTSLELRISEIEKSKSWKLTRPIRRIRNVLFK